MSDPLPRRRVRIVSDGRGPGTSVVDAETGQTLGLRLKRIEWVLEGPGYVAQVRLESVLWEADVEAEAERVPPKVGDLVKVRGRFFRLAHASVEQ